MVCERRQSGLDTSRLQKRRVHLPTLPPLTKALAWRILIFDQWRVEVLIRPQKGQRPPSLALFTLHLAAADTSFRKEPGGGGLVWAWGGYHDLSRHRCLLPWCCQGDIMNFDLKCSWLGATLVIQGRFFFLFNFQGWGWGNEAEV